MKRTMLVALILILFPVIGYSYQSLYEYPQTFYYYNVAGESLNQARTGYRYQYDYDDKIIRCGNDYEDCAFKDSYLQSLSAPGNVRQFKVYVPPGATSTYLCVYLGGQASRYVAIARMGAHPNSYGSFSGGFASLPTAGFNTNELKAGDCIVANNAGILTIATGGIPETVGGWIYVDLQQIEGEATEISYSTRVETEKYMSWFRGVDWAGFESQGGVTPGPPVSTPVPQPQPTSTPTPVPGSGDCVFGCDQNETCINGVCVSNNPTPVPSPQPTPDGCNTLLCTFSGGRCVNGVCVTNTAPTPTPEPAKEIYQTTIGEMTIKIILSDMAEIVIGEQVVEGLAYSVFYQPDMDKIVFIPGFCFLVIESGSAKVFLDSGVVLEKQ